jgi:hypothetical protein
MTHPTDDEIMELAGAWFHTGENQKRDDGYYYRSLGTPSNVRGSDLIEFARALLAEQARTEPTNLTREILIEHLRLAAENDQHLSPIARETLDAAADVLAIPVPAAPLLKAEQAKDAPTDHSADPSNMVKDAAEDAELLATVECLTDESGTEYVVVLRTKRPTLFGKGHKRESGAQKVADAINSEFGRAAMAQERTA